MSGRNFVSDEMVPRIQNSVAYTENIGNPTRPTKRRIVRQRGGGAGGVRAYVIITSVTDAANYKGNILSGPGGDVITSGVTIKVFGAEENPLSEEYANFADKVDDVYYLNGDLLQ
jgi:hypothetical protein